MKRILLTLSLAALFHCAQSQIKSTVAADNSPIRKTCSIVSPYIETMKAGQPVEVLEVLPENFLKIKYNGVEGYTLAMNIKEFPGLDALKVATEKKYQETYGKWANLVMSRNIQIGMSRSSLIAILGQPTKINTTESAAGKREQLVYGSTSAQYYYIVNGALESIQN